MWPPPKTKGTHLRDGLVGLADGYRIKMGLIPKHTDCHGNVNLGENSTEELVGHKTRSSELQEPTVVS